MVRALTVRCVAFATAGPLRAAVAATPANATAAAEIAKMAALRPLIVPMMRLLSSRGVAPRSQYRTIEGLSAEGKPDRTTAAAITVDGGRGRRRLWIRAPPLVPGAVSGSGAVLRSRTPWLLASAPPAAVAGRSPQRRERAHPILTPMNESLVLSVPNANSTPGRIVFAVAMLGVQAAILYAPSAPPPPAALRKRRIPIDKVIHMSAFAAPSAALVRAGASWSVVGAGMAVHAVVSELVQHHFLDGRSGEHTDVLANLTGVAVGLALAARWP